MAVRAQNHVQRTTPATNHRILLSSELCSLSKYMVINKSVCKVLIRDRFDAMSNTLCAFNWKKVPTSSDLRQITSSPVPSALLFVYAISSGRNRAPTPHIAAKRYSSGFPGQSEWYACRNWSLLMNGE